MIQEKATEKSPSLAKFKIPKKKSVDSESEESSEKKTEKVKEDAIPISSTSKVVPPKKVVEEVPPKSPPKPVHTSNDESDSEPELKISESDHEDDKRSEKEVEQAEKQEEQNSVKETTPDATPKDENERGQLTKAMLQNIVASIGECDLRVLDHTIWKWVFFIALYKSKTTNY